MASEQISNDPFQKENIIGIIFISITWNNNVQDWLFKTVNEPWQCEKDMDQVDVMRYD